jgi:hypothetical protein
MRVDPAPAASIRGAGLRARPAWARGKLRDGRAHRRRELASRRVGKSLLLPKAPFDTCLRDYNSTGEPLFLDEAPDRSGRFGIDDMFRISSRKATTAGVASSERQMSGVDTSLNTLGRK